MTELRKAARLTAPARRAQIEEAAIRCLARGGYRDFTVDRIMAEAGVSRGLILHHFGSMEGLLLAVYSRLYDSAIAAFDGLPAGPARLQAIIDALIGGDGFSQDASRVWIALWDLIPGHPVLHQAHRAHYATYRQVLSQALSAVAQENGRVVDADALAVGLICLVDGFGLQRGIDPELLSRSTAQQLCTAFLEPHIGRFTGHT
jgi:TetR/AcrR family transcriptional regulator, transcriptional repressor of bet genes